MPQLVALAGSAAVAAQLRPAPGMLTGCASLGDGLLQSSIRHVVCIMQALELQSRTTTAQAMQASTELLGPQVASPVMHDLQPA